jgi:phosphoadenosine phosphosulfate reductase
MRMETLVPVGDEREGSASTAPPQPRPVAAAPIAPMPAADGRLEPTADLLAELQARSDEFETAHPRQIIAWAVDRFGPRLTMATAFGPEGMIILHWLAEVGPQTHVFNLDTGYQFPETLELRDEVARRYGIDVEMRRPELSVAQYEAQHGRPLYTTNPNQCCLDRKIKVLHQAIEGKHAWISAIRRDQSTDRSRAAIIGWDKKFQLVKINPLANWTKQDVWKMVLDASVPYNPLHDRGYTSIGCWPCTRAIQFGEDERAGRWSGFAKTECGLHTTE